MLATSHDGHGSSGRTASMAAISLPNDEAAPAAARAVVMEHVDGDLPHARLEEVELLVSELVTNSVRHAGAPDAAVRLSLQVAPDRVRVEVRDGGSGFSMTPLEPRADGLGGYGLLLVDRLAERWGVVEGAGCVWFEVAR